MAAIDMLRGGRYYTDADLDAQGAESPARPVMEPTDHLGEQFTEIYKNTDEPVAASPEVPARHPHIIDGVTVHAWRSRINPQGVTP